MTAKKSISLFAICLLIISSYSTLSLSKTEDSVKIFNISGEVTILASSGKSWVKATDNMELYSGDTIKTDKNSSAEIAFDEENMNIVKIKPQSHVVIKLFKNEKIELLDGAIFSSIKNLPKGSDFEVRTPIATCGVRGTEFKVENDREKSLTTLSVLQNAVILESIQETQKHVTLTSRQERTLCPWDKTIMSAKGTGFILGIVPDKLKADPSGGKAVIELTENEYLKSYGADKMISTKRAAKVDAYRRLAGKIHGVFIGPDKNLGDYAETDGTVKKTITGIIQGSKDISTKYYDDGSVQTTVETTGRLVKKKLTPLTGDIFGIDCISGVQMVDKDEFDESLL